MVYPVVCLLLYPGGMLPYCTSWYTPPYTTLGTPHPRSCTTVLHILPLTVSGCVERKPWAQEEGIPWVRGEESLPAS